MFSSHPSGGQVAGMLVLALIALFVVIALVRSVRIVPQASALIVERLGRYARTLDAGLHLLIPFVDRVRARVDLREQVVSFPPQPVITSDNLVVSIDTVIYFQVTNPKGAVYEIFNYITGIEQLTVTTLRNVIGSMDLEQTLTSRDQTNRHLRGGRDEAVAADAPLAGKSDRGREPHPGGSTAGAVGAGQLPMRESGMTSRPNENIGPRIGSYRKLADTRSQSSPCTPTSVSAIWCR